MLNFFLWLLRAQIISSACQSLSPNVHVIIFDAGSTGTRMHLYDFNDNSGGSVLTNEVYEQVKPGLSAYVQDPEAVRQPLENLLSKARDAIPEFDRSKTTLSLGATAGLRFLPEKKAKKILNICQDVFLRSGFLVSNNSVSMLEESDEGIYCWVTANYLLEKFSSAESIVWEQSAVLDLGGGSTQVTMAVSNDFVENAKPEVRRNIHELKIGNQRFLIYTKSILGLGMKAARKEILCLINGCPDAKLKGTVEVESDCVVTEGTLDWMYMGQNFKIRGSDSLHKLKKCLEIVKQVISRYMPKDLLSLEGRKIIGASYYVDRAADARAIESHDGGEIYVQSYYEHAKKFFNNPDDSQPFLGLDLAYIYSLLHDGLKVKNDVLMTVLSKFNGYEVSWTLGNAVEVLRDGNVVSQ